MRQFHYDVDVDEDENDIVSLVELLNICRWVVTLNFIWQRGQGSSVASIRLRDLCHPTNYT